MKQKLIALGAIMAVVALFAARIPSEVHANPFSDGLTVKFTACTVVVGTCNGNGTVDATEPVGTELTTTLPTPNSSFYDSVRTVISGITPNLGVPVGDAIGQGIFHIKLTTTTTCSAASGTLTSPAYTIYAAAGAIGSGYPTNGYAKGLTTAEVTAGGWNTLFKPTWITDFDDDNFNNIPDFAEGGNGATTLPNTVKDAATLGVGPASTPAGVWREPLYMPILDSLVGQAHSQRNFGDAVVAAGILEVPVDFVAYTNYPVANQTTTLAVIQEGAALAPSILPANNSASNQATCPPFDSTLTTNALSSPSNTPTQIFNGAGSYRFDVSVGADSDSDGVPDYQDNCDAVANGVAQDNQADTDANGIGNACDTGAAIPNSTLPTPASSPCAKMGGSTGLCSATDWDGDGFSNYLDSCPYTVNTGNQEGDGFDDSCDNTPSVAGDGYGYTGSLNGSYHDHDISNTATFGAAPATGSTVTGADGAPFVDSNDNHTADSAEVLTTGTSTSTTSNSLTMTGAGWTPDAFAGQVVIITSVGTTPGGTSLHILHNTIDTLTTNPGNVWQALPPPVPGGTPPAVSAFTISFPVGSGVKPADSDGDGVLDSADTDSLDPTDGVRSATCASDCDHVTTYPYVFSQETAAVVDTPIHNFYGDGCNATDEATLTIGIDSGTTLPIHLSTTSPWDYYAVPNSALFALNPTVAAHTYRASGVIGAGGAQAIFAYFKKNAKLGTQIYNQDLNHNNVMDGVEYDRALQPNPSPTQTGPTLGPDGIIGAGEAQKAFAEFKQNPLGPTVFGPQLKCPGAGNYLMNDTTWDHP